ncbi:PIG-L deacetylase family protein [Saccharopolyspora rosea]|uniref:PIG-L deacetylase family protein n=1 Tax=Saccharopolyspora rosea TaxID=524884 RepID=A0ABW3FL06_9PSEU|nr:PIG-L deacetylase family protein [Saccharopolyspora rosea]
MTTPAGSSADVRRALVVTAHPDDVDFGAAGTVASWTAAGISVSYCICTSGEAGACDGVPREEVPRLREEEQRAAAAAVGVTDVRFLRHQDGRVTPDLRLRRDITEVIREVRPDRVVTHSPEINWAHVAVSHPDHRAVGEAAFAAVYPDARNEFAHPELLDAGLRPWTVRELWMSESPEERINHTVDITDQFDAKLAALAAHRSQTSHLDDLRGMIRRHLERTAERYGRAGRLAEAFHVVNTA